MHGLGVCACVYVCVFVCVCMCVSVCVCVCVVGGKQPFLLSLLLLLLYLGQHVIRVYIYSNSLLTLPSIK